MIGRSVTVTIPQPASLSRLADVSATVRQVRRPPDDRLRLDDAHPVQPAAGLADRSDAPTFSGRTAGR
jgi:hypothetical protein